MLLYQVALEPSIEVYCSNRSQIFLPMLDLLNFLIAFAPNVHNIVSRVIFPTVCGTTCSI